MNFLIMPLEHLESENSAEHDGDRDEHDHHAFDHLTGSGFVGGGVSLAAWTICGSGLNGSGLTSTRFHQPPPSAANKAAVSAIARGLRLHQRKKGLLIAALGVEQNDVGYGAEPVLAARQDRRSRTPRARRAVALSASRRPIAARASASATFWKAVSTVLRYCASATS
jgi:hypothetical protein